MFVNEIFNCQVILTHVLKKKLAKYYMYLGLKWTDKEGGIHLLESLEWKVSCEDICFLSV